jgi:hypothetical protein
MPRVLIFTGTYALPLMRYSTLFLFLAFAVGLRAQLGWVSCTMPVNTLTVLAMGPNGELVTLLNTNPAQPRISTDQGQTWTNAPGTGGPNGNFLSETRLHLTITGTLLVWGSVNGGSSYGLWRSADGGNNFAPVPGVPGNRYFFGLCSGPWGDVYLYGEGVLHSTDDGLSWTSIVDAGTPITALAATTTHIWGVQLGTVYRGALDGSGFAPIATGGYDITNGLGIARGMNERVILVGGNDRLITTADAGSTWQSPTTGITSTLNGELQHVAASLSSDRWVTAKQIAVFSTDNGGAPWADASAGLGFAGNEPIQGIFCDSTSTFYVYGYFHLYRSDASTAIAEVDAAPGMVYPNPATDVVRISGWPAGTAVQVLDAAGRMVRRIRVGGDGRVELQGLCSGRYLLRNALGAVLPVQVVH